MSEHPGRRKFTQERHKLLEHRQKAELWLEQSSRMGVLINDTDRERLARVLSLIDKYQPVYRDRLETTLEKPTPVTTLRFLRERLQTMLRLFSRAAKPESEPALSPESLSVDVKPEQRSAQTYVLAEQLVHTLRELRKYDRMLSEEYTTSSIVDLANQTRDGDPVSQEIMPTSLTLDYQRDQWGIERICLDGAQNHLPADALGTQIGIVCEVDGKWIPLAEAQVVKEKVTAVSFVDDGVGYDVKNLSLFWTSKLDDPASAGQFGEGLKMLAAAALRSGIDATFSSQNWEAKPVVQPDTINDTRNRRVVAVERLGFDVQRYQGEARKGSATTLRKFPPAFMDEVVQLPDKVLALREGYKPLYSSPQGDVVDTGGGKVFVKGVYVAEAKTLLTYNFTDVEVNRDRNAVINGLERPVNKMLDHLSDARVIKTILQKSFLNQDAVECTAYCYGRPEYPTAWQKAFTQLYGEAAVLDTGHQTPAHIKLNQKKIQFSHYLNRRLEMAGVKTDIADVPSRYTERLVTSFTTEYGKDAWDEGRIMLDAVQNHLPDDSGGRTIDMRFQTRDGSWHKYDELSLYTVDSDITALRITDDGRGYDHQKLGVLVSDKPTDDGSGKFGEGLKMITTACLRFGIGIEFASRQWRGVAKTEPIEIDGKKIDQVVFDVTHNLQDGAREGSMTVLQAPTATLVQEFRHIGENILGLNGQQHVEIAVEGGEVLSYAGGLLFIRRIIIPGNHNLLFSYHFPKLEMKNRDRNTVSWTEIRAAVGNVLGQASDPNFISHYLSLAERAISRQQPDPNLTEFTLPFQIHDPTAWKKVFEQNFGENTAIRPASSLDFDGVGQLEHVGLQIVTLPDAVYGSLLSIGLPTYEERTREMTDVHWLDADDLTPDEQAILVTLHQLDPYLPGDLAATIRVFTEKSADQRVAMGLSSGSNIGLYRGVLAQGLEQAADVYLHEKTHSNTGGALDASAVFRDYLTLALARVSMKLLQQEKPGGVQRVRQPDGTIINYV